MQSRKKDQDEQRALKQALEAKEREYSEQQNAVNAANEMAANLKKATTTAKAALDAWLAANNNTPNEANAEYN